MFGKKKSLGFHAKPRTLDEINQDYNNHAAQAGHKARIVTEIQAEIENHIQRMLTINLEAKKIQEAPKKEPDPTPSPEEGKSA